MVKGKKTLLTRKRRSVLATTAATNDGPINSNDSDRDNLFPAHEVPDDADAAGDSTMDDDEDDDGGGDRDDDNDNDNEKDVFTQTHTQMEKVLSQSINVRSARQKTTMGKHDASDPSSSTVRFDLNPREEVLRRVRQGYGSLMDQMSSHQADLVKPEDTQLSTLVNDANTLFQQVSSTPMATWDSRFMARSADISAERLGHLASSGRDFTADDFVAALRRKLLRLNPQLAATQTITSLHGASSYGDRNEDYAAVDEEDPDADEDCLVAAWRQLGRAAVRDCWIGVQVPDFMLGPISVPPVERTRRTLQPRSRMDSNEADASSHPIVVAAGDQGNTEADSATRSVIAVFRCLQKVSPVQFYRFIIDPTSFSRTVENLFYVSFLIRDNRVALETNAEGELLLRVSPSSIDTADKHPSSSSSQPITKHQAIFSMTMARWREEIRRFQLSEPLIHL
jgi:hypothetical protein